MFGKLQKEIIERGAACKQPTQEELMAQAFGDENVEEEFAAEKEAAMQEDVDSYKREHGIQDTPVLEGWGSWAGIVVVGRGRQ